MTEFIVGFCLGVLMISIFVRWDLKNKEANDEQ